MQHDHPSRYRQLDSLRGVAAFVVVLGHLYLSMNDDCTSGLFNTPISPFITGQFAVDLFFVLSGFVLSLPYLRGTNQQYLPYAVRRVCRLYGPFAFAVIASVALRQMFDGHSPQALTRLVRNSWDAPLSSKVLFAHFSMAGYPNGVAIWLDLPIWSLIVEMRVSLIFPLLVFFTRRFGWTWTMVNVGLSLAAANIKSSLGDPSRNDGTTLLGTALLTVWYVPYFVFGIMCAARLKSIGRWLTRLPGWIHMVAAPGWLCVAALIARTGMTASAYADVFYGLSSAYLISCCVVFAAPARVLMHRWCVWLGQVSFSLYLIHWPVMLVAYYLLSAYIPRLLVLALTLPASLIAAHIMERWVERPSHELGKRLSRHLESRLQPQSA